MSTDTRNGRARTGYTDRLRALAGQPAGVTVTEACRAMGLPDSKVSAMVRYCVTAATPTLWRVRAPGVHKADCWRYFSSQYAAQQYAHRIGSVVDDPGRRQARIEMTRRAAKQQQTARKQMRAEIDTGRAAKAAQSACPPPVRISPARGPAHLPGEPVITSQTRVTIAPAPTDPRYAVTSVRRHVRADECRAWADGCARNRGQR